MLQNRAERVTLPLQLRRMMRPDPPQCHVVVPAYLEARLIARTLRDVPSYVRNIIVVDDGSGDDTSQVVRHQGDPRVTLLRHATNAGVGAAIVSGYRALMRLGGSAQDAFAVMAGDGQMHPDDLWRVASPVMQGEADYVKGNRFADPTTARAMPRARFLGGHTFSILTSLAVGRRVSDTQCGYTALSRRAAERLDLDSLWPRYGYPNDMIARVLESHLKLLEVPVRAVYRDETSTLRLRHLPPIAGILCRAAMRRVLQAAHG